MIPMESKGSLARSWSSKPVARDVVVVGLGTAIPTKTWSQKDIFSFLTQRFSFSPRTKALYKKILHNPSVLSRAFSLSSLDQAIQSDPDERTQRFEKAAVDLASQALKGALQQANITPKALDFLVSTTCTGYLCPGLSSYLVETVGLRANVHGADLVGMGCGAAIPALEQATHFVRANPGTSAAVVCTEICSTTFFDSEDPEVVISNALFGDGAAAVILQSRSKSAQEETGKLNPVLRGFGTLTIPEWRDTLRFRREKGLLRNVLDKTVPQKAASATKKLVNQLLHERGVQQDDVSYWVVHAGGEKVLDAFQTEFSLSPEDLTSSRTILRNHENMSSPTVLFVLADLMKSQKPNPGDWAILTSFGAGFSTHAALVQFAF